MMKMQDIFILGKNIQKTRVVKSKIYVQTKIICILLKLNSKYIFIWETTLVLTDYKLYVSYSSTNCTVLFSNSVLFFFTTDTLKENYRRLFKNERKTFSGNVTK